MSQWGELGKELQNLETHAHSKTSFQRQGPADLQPFRHEEKYIQCRFWYRIRHHVRYRILYVVYDIVCDITYIWYRIRYRIINNHEVSPWLRRAPIFQKEQGLWLVLAVPGSRCPEPFCPGHSSPAQWTEKGQGDTMIQDSVPWGYVVQTAGRIIPFIIRIPCTILVIAVLRRQG